MGGSKDAYANKNFSKRATAPAPSWRRYLHPVALSDKKQQWLLCDSVFLPQAQGRSIMPRNGPLVRYVNCGFRMRRECRERFPPPRFNDPDMHHDTCVTHVSWCMPVSLTSSFLWIRWQGKRFWHSRRMLNPQFYVSGKRPMWPGTTTLSTLGGNISGARMNTTQRYWDRTALRRPEAAESTEVILIRHKPEVWC